MITKTASRLADIEHDIRDIKELYFRDKVSYRLANLEIEELKEEREHLWAQ